MACLLGVRQSFVRAETALVEVAGWALDDNAIRKLCHVTAAHASATRADRTTAATFARAQDEARPPIERELHLDAGKVNTLEGWRDVKVAVFACRERGEPTTVATWDERDLPPPAARSVVAAIEEASLFGERRATEARRLELTESAALSVPGDGAEWLWHLAERHFAGADQLLDFWHGAEHLGDGAKAVCGAGTAEAQAAARCGKRRLPEDGYWGVTQWVGTLADKAVGGDGAALAGVLNYFCDHRERLNYALRLRRGQSVGSGLVEGSIKQLLNKRLKQTGARWKFEHVGPLVEFGALAVGPEWQAFWENN